MKSGVRLIAVLGLFSPEHPVITIEEAAQRLGISESMMYRYFSTLSDVGLIEPVRGAGYALGPTIIAYDWQIRNSDPMLKAAKPSMRWLLANCGITGGAILLCRLYRDLVMCVHQELDQNFKGNIGYERGRPMPLLRGAPSKIILANLPLQSARNLFEAHASEIKKAGLGASFEVFNAHLQEIRRAGYAVSREEVDPGRGGIAAPIFVADRIAGSICVVAQQTDITASLIVRLAALAKAAASEISGILSGDSGELEAASRSVTATGQRRREQLPVAAAAVSRIRVKRAT